MKYPLGLCFLLSFCTPEPSHPDWWLTTPTRRLRESLLYAPAETVLQAEAEKPYYSDTLGLTFRYAPPEGGTFWVEYYLDVQRKVQSITFTWEHSHFPYLSHTYQQLRKTFEKKYGPERGPVGDLSWQVSDSLQILLRLSPERQFLHMALARL